MYSIVCTCAIHVLYVSEIYPPHCYWEWHRVQIHPLPIHIAPLHKTCKGEREGERGRGEGEWERGEERGGGRDKRRGEINWSLILIINQLQASRGCVNERSSTPPYHNKSQQTRPPMAIFTTTKFSLRLHNLPTGILSTVHQVTNTFCAHHLFMVCQYYLSQMGGGVHT